MPRVASPSWNMCLSAVTQRKLSGHIAQTDIGSVQFFTCFYYIIFFSIFLFVSILRHLANHNGMFELPLPFSHTVKRMECVRELHKSQEIIYAQHTQDTLVSNAREWHAPFSIELSSVSGTVIIYRHASTYVYLFGPLYRDEDDNNDGSRTSALVQWIRYVPTYISRFVAGPLFSSIHDYICLPREFRIL